MFIYIPAHFLQTPLLMLKFLTCKRSWGLWSSLSEQDGFVCNRWFSVMELANFHHIVSMEIHRQSDMTYIYWVQSKPMSTESNTVHPDIREIVFDTRQVLLGFWKVIQPVFRLRYSDINSTSLQIFFQLIKTMWWWWWWEDLQIMGWKEAAAWTWSCLMVTCMS